MDYLIVCAVLGLVIGGLVFSRLRPLTIFSMAALTLYLFNVLPLEALAHNYVNSALLTLVLLLLLSVVLERTLLLSLVARHVVHGGLKSILFRLTLLSGLTSSLLNNTAVVAALMGPLQKQSGMLASRLLLPLSYASILGGMLTLIGTSTNMIVNGFIEQAGEVPFKFLDFTLVGAAVFLFCGLTIVFVSSRVLPERQIGQDKEERDYFIERQVMPGSELVGKSISENGLRNLEKLYLVDVVRGDQVISPVGPDEVVNAGDVLVFSGDLSALSLLDRFAGLVTYENNEELVRSKLVEVVISPSSVLLGRTVRDVDFRSRFDAAVVAVRRGEARLKGGVGRLVLRAGDSLVLSVGADFKGRDNLARNFILLGGVKHQAELNMSASLAVVGGFVAAVVLAALGVMSFFKGLLILLVAFMLFGLVRFDELRRRFPFELVLVVGGALGIAQAMVASGVAADMAAAINNALSGQGVYGAFIGVFVMTWLLTELITNNAAAALVFPIALAVAQQWGVSPYPFFMAVAFGASASFLSPYGYQTNLMVFSVGRYRLSDYLRAGLPVLVVYSITALITIPMVFPF